MCRKFLEMLACVAVFLLAGCEKAPRIDHEALARYAFEDFSIYCFQFDFTNPSSQPVTIKAVEVFDPAGQPVQHSAQFYQFLAKTHYPAERLTHDTGLAGDPNHPFAGETFAPIFGQSTPLERAILIYHQDHAEKNSSDPSPSVTFKPIARVMRGHETIHPARYLLFTHESYEALRLKITYENAEGTQTLEQPFDLNPKKRP